MSEYTYIYRIVTVQNHVKELKHNMNLLLLEVIVALTPCRAHNKRFEGPLGVSLMEFWQVTQLSCCARVPSQTDIQVRLQRAFTEDDRLVYYRLAQ